MADAAPQPAYEEEQQPPPPTVIVPEDDAGVYNDADSALGSIDAENSTSSITSSVLRYQYENGRRYHAFREGQYVMPNDEREQDRMDLHHHIYRLVVGGDLYRAPIGNPSRILDIGTGTGIWAVEMADECPSATIIGTDLSPIQPSWVPPNCVFEIDDLESTWNFSQPFDFVHGRGLEGSVKDWQQLMKQALEHLKPGGWLELVDATVNIFSDDDTIDRSANMLEWAASLREGSAKFGKRMGVAHEYKAWMIDAGFHDVREEVYKVPLNPWAKNPKMKELGRYYQVMMLEALEAYSMALFTRVLGWTTPRIQLLLAGVRKELHDRTIHTYAKIYFVYGQKEQAP